MKKVFDFIKWPLAFPALGLAGLYLFWFLVIPIEFNQSDDFFGNYQVGLVFFCIYLTFTVLIKAVRNNWVHSLGILILIGLPTWMSIFFTSWFIHDSILYFGYSSEEDWVFISFVIGIIALTIYPTIKLFRIKYFKKNKAIYYILALALYLLLCGNVLYFVSYIPITKDKAVVGNYSYSILRSRDLDKYSDRFAFYKCKKWSLSCDQLYFSYWYGAPEKIIVDEQKNELSLFTSIMSPRLVYTYGENSRTYQGYPIQLGEHIYQLSDDWILPEGCDDDTYRDCDYYVYSLFRCNLDFKLCNKLPIQYIGDYSYTFTLESNSETNEIELYDEYKEEGGNLIFTYGENPRCYVEGCEILDE